MGPSSVGREKQNDTKISFFYSVYTIIHERDTPSTPVCSTSGEQAGNAMGVHTMRQYDMALLHYVHYDGE